MDLTSKVTFNKGKLTINVPQLTEEEFIKVFSDIIAKEQSVWLYFIGMKTDEFKMLLEKGMKSLLLLPITRGVFENPRAKELIKLMREYNVKYEFNEDLAKYLSKSLIDTDLSRVGNLSDLPTDQFSLLLNIKNNDNTTILDEITNCKDDDLRLKLNSTMLG